MNKFEKILKIIEYHFVSPGDGIYEDYEFEFIGDILAKPKAVRVICKSIYNLVYFAEFMALQRSCFYSLNKLHESSNDIYVLQYNITDLEILLTNNNHLDLFDE